MLLIQDIFKKYGGVYLDMYAKNIPSIHKKALKAIMNCRTKSLGGEVYYCHKCSEFHFTRIKKQCAVIVIYGTGYIIYT